MKKILFALLLISSVSCLEKQDLTLEENSFFRIYDNAGFTASFTPIDVAQTEDGGYLILAGKRMDSGNFKGIYLLRVDKAGTILNEVEDFDPNYVHPVGPLAFVNGAYYFFCMDATFQEAQLIRVTANGDFDTAFPTGLTYPMAATAVGSEMMLLSYDNTDKVMMATQFDGNGTVSEGPEVFSIGEGDDTEEPIINHFIQGGREFPFSIGSLGGNSFYFNGFYQYTFSLVFASWNNGVSGVVYGTQDDGGFSAVLPLSGSQFSAARFNFGDNYLLPTVTLNTSGITIGSDLDGYALPELESNATIKLLTIESGSNNTVLFASNTQSRQIALLAYNATDGTFKNSRYLGFSNPFEIGTVIETSDNGLAVLGLTYVAGRFPRLCLFKLSSDEAAALLN